MRESRTQGRATPRAAGRLHRQRTRGAAIENNETGEHFVTDRDVSIGCVVAYGLWLGSSALLAVAWVHAHAGLGRVALALSVAAATATIRQYFVAQNKLMRNAFELGKASVRPLR